MGNSFISVLQNNGNLRAVLNEIDKRKDNLTVFEASELNYFDLSEVNFNSVLDVEIGDEETNKVILRLFGGFVVIEKLNISDFKETALKNKNLDDLYKWCESLEKQFSRDDDNLSPYGSD